MVNEFKHSVTYYSKLNFPEGRGLVNERLDLSTKTRRIGNSLEITITPTYVMTIPGTNNEVEVLKSETKYELATNGELTIEDVYRAFHHAMVALISGLNKMEKEQGMTITTHLSPFSLEVVQPDLQKAVDYFLAKN